jgi:hypothetical protein
MKKETVNALMNNLIGPLSLIRDIHVKVTALEETLKEQRPELFEIYQQKVREIAQNPRISFNLLGVENLRKILLDE